MYKKKKCFIVFEGREGSGKTLHCFNLFKKIKNLGFNAILTKEPGGLKSTRSIRKIILDGKKNKFNKITDLLLYLASRSEHVEKLIKPSLDKKKIVICDRFVDSTIAYQVHGKKINKKLISNVHNEILGSIKPNLTFLLKVPVNEAMKRIKKRKKLNRYDKLSKKFYSNAQKGYLNLAKYSKKKYIIIDSMKDIKVNERIIFDNFFKIINS